MCVYKLILTVEILSLKFTWNGMYRGSFLMSNPVPNAVLILDYQNLGILSICGNLHNLALAIFLLM